MSARAPQGSRQNRYFKPVMAGLAVGSACFLFLRFAFGLGVDPSLVVAAFFGAAVTVFMMQKPQ
jgi:hypothetical protein